MKRLKAVDITPDGTLQIITGRNAQGKTSVLDAIWLALGGGASFQGGTHQYCHQTVAEPDMTDRRPHSRACGWRKHDHGVDCSSNCPTCGGKEIS